MNLQNVRPFPLFRCLLTISFMILFDFSEGYCVGHDHITKINVNLICHLLKLVAIDLLVCKKKIVVFGRKSKDKQIPVANSRIYGT